MRGWHHDLWYVHYCSSYPLPYLRDIRDVLYFKVQAASINKVQGGLVWFGLRTGLGSPNSPSSLHLPLGRCMYGCRCTVWWFRLRAARNALPVRACLSAAAALAWKVQSTLQQAVQSRSRSTESPACTGHLVASPTAPTSFLRSARTVRDVIDRFAGL